MKTLQVLLPAMLVLAAGCTSTETLATRLEKNKDTISQLSPEQQENLRNYTPKVGDKKQEVLIALGKPTFVSRKGQTEEFVYPTGNEIRVVTNLVNNEPVHARPSRREPVTSDLVIVFQDDLVVAIKGRGPRKPAAAYLEKDSTPVPPDREPKWEPQTQAQMGVR